MTSGHNFDLVGLWGQIRGRLQLLSGDSQHKSDQVPKARSSVLKGLIPFSAGQSEARSNVPRGLPAGAVIVAGALGHTNYKSLSKTRGQRAKRNAHISETDPRKVPFTGPKALEVSVPLGGFGPP